MSPSASWIRCVASLRLALDDLLQVALALRAAVRRPPAARAAVRLRAARAPAVACCVTSCAELVELGAQACDQLALLLDLALQPLGVLTDARLDLGHQLALACLDALQLVGQAAPAASRRRCPSRPRRCLDGPLRRARAGRRASRSRRARARRRRGGVPRRCAAPPRRARESASARSRASIRSSSSLRCSSSCATTTVELALAALDLALERVLLVRAHGAASARRSRRARRPRRARRRSRRWRQAVTPFIVGAPRRARRRARRSPASAAAGRARAARFLPLCRASRRARRTGVESARCARLSANA